jgi:hypothetical protein
MGRGGGFGPYQGRLSARQARLQESRHRTARVESTLYKDYPDLFNKAKALLIKWGAQVSDDELALELGRIIYPAKPLQMNDKYQRLLREFSDDASTASAAIFRVQSRLNKIDTYHLSECFAFMSMFSDVAREDWGGMIVPEKLYRSINDAGELLDQMGRWIDFVTDYPGKKKGRGQPPIPYWRETLALLKMWEELTGRPVLTAKGKLVAQGGRTEGVQPSTEFIRLCLKMIMPGITLSNVHTLINRVRKEAKKSIYSAPRASSST